MERDLGVLLKKIRKGKGIAQEELCGDYISRAALSKIENGKNIPSYRSLSYLLDKLDMSFDEFEYLLDDPQGKKEIILKFWSVSDSAEKDKLDNIVDLCKIYLEKNKMDHMVSDIKTIAEVLLSLPSLAVGTLPEESKLKVEKIWHRLNKMDVWTLNDLKLATTSFFYFPLETSIHIANRVVKEMRKYEHFDKIQSYIVVVYINLTTLYMKTHDMESIEYFNEKALFLSEKNNRHDVFYFCNVRKGIYTGDKQMIEEGLAILKLLGKHSYIQELEKEISWFNTENTPSPAE